MTNLTTKQITHSKHINKYLSAKWILHFYIVWKCSFTQSSETEKEKETKIISLKMFYLKFWEIFS